jgi:hypothetical protein
MKKDNKKTAVFYDESGHYTEMNNANESGQTFKRAKNNLEAIINKPISDYTAFRSDVLGYAMAEIKKTFPKPFELGLTDEATLKMLSIDLSQLTTDSYFLATTPFKFCVCPNTGEATPDECKDPFIWYAETKEQHERLDFCNELANILERAYLFTPHTFKSNVTNGLTHIVYFDVQTETIKPNHYFVMNGIQ